MATTAFARPSHPALTFGYPTPPATPTTPSPSSPSFTKPHSKPTPNLTTITSHPALPPFGKPTLQPPSPNYALLRSHHVSALKYMIAKLRWEQAHNGYIPGESAWREHSTVIQDLEEELKTVQAAQRDLDAFYPHFCHAPIAQPTLKPYGPKTKEQVVKAKADAEKRDAEMEKEIEKQFPFIKQLFIGPMTKEQARNDRMLRECLKAGNVMDIAELLPPENLAMVTGEKPEKKRPYHEVRMEREKEKIKVILEEEAARLAKLPPRKETARIGPVTEKEYIATLPVFGPKTRGEAMLPIQRDQRQVILNFLRKPWLVFDEQAAGLMERMGGLAVKRLNQEVKVREAKEAREAKDARDAKEEKEHKEHERKTVKKEEE